MTLSSSTSVILVSGGIDSATTLAWARHRGDKLFAMSFDYGQRHRVELEAARAVAKHLQVTRHLIQTVDLRRIGGSALTDPAIEVPLDRDATNGRSIPITYVPARNLIFLSLALAWAEVVKAGHILIGANAVDYSGYPDCRPEFLRSFRETARLATRTGIEGAPVGLEAPLLHRTKAEIIRLGVELGVDFSLTMSCYSPDDAGLACGHCDSCRIRRRGFEEAGIADPTKYDSENR